MTFRNWLAACVMALLCMIPAAAQVANNLHLNASGDVNAGYSGDFGDSGSDHGLGLGGSGSIGGYYYNPNFASFSVMPYYGRSQSNSTSSSIFDSSGYNGSVNLFGGSSIPGSITFNQNWNSTGNFGLPGLAGLTTNNDSRSIGVGWSLSCPAFPPYQ